MEGRPLEDPELVERSRHGDQDAYAELVTRYQALAARTAYVITGSEDDAQDAAQAINRRKARGRRPTVGLSMAMDRPSPDTALSPEGAALASERRERVLAALREMREEDRVVIAYRYFFDLSEAEMAQALDVARGTVKSRLSRAIARLREHMGEETAE